MKAILREFGTALRATVILAAVVCGLYPALVTAVAQAVFPAKANGSLVVRDGRVEGSTLLGRSFSGARYFHPRPSAAGTGYDAIRSGGSNLGPTSRTLIETIGRRALAYRTENGLPPDVPVPVDAVTASGSGLDPHISLANALLQAPRVARARGLSAAAVQARIEALAEGRWLGFLGEPRVNVLVLNLALDDGDRGDHAGR